MATKIDAIVVLVTCKSKVEAHHITMELVKMHLAACGNIVESSVTSIYRWKGKIERAKEYLLILKSTRKAFAALEKEVTRLHSYEVPEIIALPVAHGSKNYLAWIAESVGEN